MLDLLRVEKSLVSPTYNSLRTSSTPMPIHNDCGLFSSVFRFPVLTTVHHDVRRGVPLPETIVTENH